MAYNLPSLYYFCLVLLVKLNPFHKVFWEISPLPLFSEECIDKNYLLYQCLVELTCKLDLVVSLWEDLKLLVLSLKLLIQIAS